MKFILEIIYLCPHQIVVIIRVTYYASARSPHWAEYYLATIPLLFQVRLVHLPATFIYLLLRPAGQFPALWWGALLARLAPDIYPNVLDARNHWWFQHCYSRFPQWVPPSPTRSPILWFIALSVARQSVWRQQYHRCICLKSHLKHARKSIKYATVRYRFGQILIFYVNYKIASIAADTAYWAWLALYVCCRYYSCILFCILVF